MTVKRDKKTDIKETNRIILKNNKPLFTGTSWLGHTKDCGIIDHELLKGATKKQLATRSGRELSGVEGHISHLKSEHGLSISNNNGIYKFEFFNEELNKTISKEELFLLMNEDIDTVCKNCIVELLDNDQNSKWYSVGIESPNYNDKPVTPMNIEKLFAQSILNKRIHESTPFGNGFKIKSIKRFLS